MKPWRARAFYGLIVAATLVGILINFLGIKPIAALFWSAVFNRFLASPLLVVILLIVNNGAVMDKRVAHRATNVLGSLTAALMSAAALLLELLRCKPWSQRASVPCVVSVGSVEGPVHGLRGDHARVGASAR